MELEVNILYSLALDVGQTYERCIKSFISDFGNKLGSNNEECLKILGDIEACIEILEIVEKGYLVSALVLQKPLYDFKINDLKKKALELNNKLHMFIYTVHKDYRLNLSAIYVIFLTLKKHIYGEENLKIYFQSLINALVDKKKK